MRGGLSLPWNQIMSAPRLVLLIFSLSFLGGCTTTQSFNSTPGSAEDFRKPLTDIRSEFSDVELYESYWRGIPATVGDYNDLEEKWGKADKVEKNWGEKLASTTFGAALVAFNALPVAAFLAIEAIFIYPNETHYWSKGDTQVKVLATRLGVNGYEYRVGRWEWKKVNIGDQTGEVSLLIENKK